jgi:hypothetical protein
MVTYRQRVREIEQRLAGRRLVYFGTRGTDARPLLELTNFEEVFSQIAPLEATSIKETCLETLKHERVDLNRYSIDLDPSEKVHDIRRGLLQAFGRPSAVIPYRPCAVLASACFTRANLVQYLGIFHEKQACFEHKPWVETQLRTIGLPVVPWTYFADDDLALIREAAEAGPLVLRANRSDGGAGLTLIHNPAQIQQSWPVHLDGFLAAAPFLDPCIPLNVNACVFPGSYVSIHPASLQLIGIPICTGRRFGYCGNDFARIADLDVSILGALEKMTLRVGGWLGTQGYLGAFGIDAVLHKGSVYLVEVNPRFQGSSALAATLMRDLDLPDLFLDHVAAFLGLSAPHAVPLADITRNQSPSAHIVCHNIAAPRRIEIPTPDRLPLRCSLLPRPDVTIAREGILFEAVVPGRVTTTGAELLDDIDEQVRHIAQEVARNPRLLEVEG